VAWSAAVELETVSLDAALEMLLLTLDEQPARDLKGADRS
jgi:hypothetical protein